MDEFHDWSIKFLTGLDLRNKVSAPLYHYTDAIGLEGIIKNQEIWFTSCKHMNDPSEIAYGLSVAKELLNEIGERSDTRIKYFCDIVSGLITSNNLFGTFGFFTATCSRDRDDLGQWRAYGDNGCGFALGLADHVFHVEEKEETTQVENVFVAQVTYGRHAARQHHMPAIAEAIRIVGNTVSQFPDLMADARAGSLFLYEVAESLIASHMIFNCLAIKHEAYSHERETRLVILGEHQKLNQKICTRPRRGDIVPFIKHSMPIRSPGSIVEIVIGPSCAEGAKDGLKVLLESFEGAPSTIVSRSTIPYRSR